MRLSPLLALTQFLIFRVRKRIVANVDSIGFVVRMCCQCAAGKS